MIMIGAKRFRDRLKDLAWDSCGSAIIEAGLVVPILATLVAGVADLSMGYSAKLKLQQAATRSIALATAGGLNSAAFGTLQQEAAQAAGVPQSQVVVDAWLECSGARQTSINDVCATGKTVARYVSVSISGQYSPTFGFLLHTAHMTRDGKIPISGYAEVRVQ